MYCPDETIGLFVRLRQGWMLAGNHRGRQRSHRTSAARITWLFQEAKEDGSSQEVSLLEDLREGDYWLDICEDSNSTLWRAVTASAKTGAKSAQWR